MASVPVVGSTLQKLQKGKQKGKFTKEKTTRKLQYGCRPLEPFVSHWFFTAGTLRGALSRGACWLMSRDTHGIALMQTQPMLLKAAKRVGAQIVDPSLHEGPLSCHIAMPDVNTALAMLWLRR
jgi:hypothetical protein